MSDSGTDTESRDVQPLGSRRLWEGQGCSTSGSAHSESASGCSDTDAVYLGKRVRKQGDSKRFWNASWESEFLVSYDKMSDTVTCLKCMGRIETVKKYNIQRHCERLHPEVRQWSEERRKLFIQQAKTRVNKMRNTLTSVFQPSVRLSEATYKLCYTLVKHHKPVSFAEPMVNWAVSCDPESKVFKNMSKSRQTITRRITDLAAFIQSETLSKLKSAPAWGLLIDESTDTADHAQAVLYVCLADIDHQRIVTKFLTILQIEGSPSPENLYTTVNTYVTFDPEGQACLFH